MITIEQILSEYRSTLCIPFQLKEAEKYLAHTPKNNLNKKSETLSEHLELVEDYFLELIIAHGLESIINGLISKYLDYTNLESQRLGNFIKTLFVQSICYHDHGKINENFQSFKMNNNLFVGKENNQNGIGSQHSTLSAFIFLNHKIEEALSFTDLKEQQCAFSLSILFSYGIYKHHASGFKDDFLAKILKENKLSPKLTEYLELFRLNISNTKIPAILNSLEDILSKVSFNKYAQSFPLYQLLRLNFSLLTAADYLATNEYMSDDKTVSFGTFNRDRIKELIQLIRKNEWLDNQRNIPNFNKKTYDELDSLIIDQPQEKSNKNLNLLRQQMATEAIRNVRLNADKNIFYIEAPTGGGKTNISMLVTLELLQTNEELNKVFYVFPFTTLIDQTYKSIKQSLNLSEKEIVALHSKAPFPDDEEDGQYGDCRKNYISHLFIHYPFSLLSHIRFFNILKSNHKETNYLLHRLANSVVVIDELQSYDPIHWDKVMYFIKQYADTYNIRFIIMSATLPKIHKLKIKGLDLNDVVYLIPNSKQDYFLNPNFSKRINFDFSLLQNEHLGLPEIAKNVITESKNYSLLDGGIKKPLGSVFTIIEFIFKKSATQFASEIKRIDDDFFDEIFVLSGTILPHRRQYIINYLKNNENRCKKILLITTQVVEAGVDIDMDIGFKDTSLIDSDEQLGGRINRNVNKEGCKLFLFNYNKEAIIYGKDLRLQMEQEGKINQEDRMHILQSKDFDLLYDKVIAYKDKRNDPKSNYQNINTYVNLIKKLQFKSVADNFNLINQENISCFIPLSVPIVIDGEAEKKDPVFTYNDLVFLKNYGVFPSSENEISGEEVFDLYIRIINTPMAFHDRKLELKRLQPIISKFVFSLFATKKISAQIIHFSDEEKSEYGYKYIERWKNFYKLEYGIDDSEFYSNETQFL
jgi:CRISPR-associated endonuclease/helicase Cas3